MYYLVLFATAFLMISIFSTNWPIKLYHHLYLKKIAQELNTQPERYGLLLSNVYSEINTVFQGKKFRIRFIENSIDSLKPNSGLEISMSENTGVIMEFYPVNRRKKVWGDYQQFLTGDPLIDSEWFILTTDLEGAKKLWDRTQLIHLFKDFSQLMVEVLINREEIFVQLKNYRSSKVALNVLRKMASI